MAYTQAQVEQAEAALDSARKADGARQSELSAIALSRAEDRYTRIVSGEPLERWFNGHNKFQSVK